jgi:hypothetical protein
MPPKNIPTLQLVPQFYQTDNIMFTKMYLDYDSLVSKEGETVNETWN